MYKESIDRENKKLKDELRGLKAAMRNIGSDTPSSATTRDLLRLPTPKSSFSSHIPGLKTLIDASKPISETERRGRVPEEPIGRTRTWSQDRDVASEAEAIKTEVEQELASLRDKLDAMKTQHSVKKPPLSPPVSAVLDSKADIAVQTDLKANACVAVQTDSLSRFEVAVQTKDPEKASRTHEAPQELLSIEVRHEDTEEAELMAEFELLRDENAALRTLLNRKEQRESQDYDQVPTKEKTTKKAGKAAKPKCDFCGYLQSHGLPLSACRRHHRK